MPEIGLGIGRENGICEQWQRDWLYWYDEQGNRYPELQKNKQVQEQIIQYLSRSDDEAMSWDGRSPLFIPRVNGLPNT